MERHFVWGLFLFFILFVIASAGKLWENVDADRIVCIQSPLAGKLNWYTTAGVKWQGFGKVTEYYKLDTYEFKVPVRFNDGGHGTMIGSLNYIEDQIQGGVYKTTQRETKTKDPITGAEKTVTVVEIVKDSNGNPGRQEEAVLKSYGIKTSNFAVTSLPYDDVVEQQIKQQQELTMKVQTAVASAKEAEQRAITVAKEGEANAAAAKWAQEVEKAKAVTLAQQEFDVAQLGAESAEQKKRAEILLGEGEATRKKLVMQADGALEKNWPRMWRLKRCGRRQCRK